jgi:arylsulfatase A-like enzyme/Tfp pilus assembly protein PilF
MVPAKPRNIVIILLIIALITVIAGYFVCVSFRPQPKIRNVVLISMDTTRAENLSCYGVYKNATPQIDALAKEAVLFQNTYSPIPLTLPSHSTMLTGMYPPRHGIHDNLKYQLNDKNITLAEILKDNGFATAAVISAFILDSRFGLDQGFDIYDDNFDEELENANIAQRRGAETTDHAISWLLDNKDNPFFLFIHYYDPHMPYDPPEPFKSMIFHPYFAEIAYTDHCIGQVIDKLKALDLYDSTLIIITADHGEMLGEHKEQTHGYFIYQGNIKVPLIFKLPGKRKAKTVDDIAGTVDIAPTVCSLLGIDIPKNVQGKDLSAYLGNDAASRPKDRHLYSESMTATKYGGNSLLGLIDDRYKYIQTTRPELYDLINDPKEADDLIARQQGRARILQDKLKQILEESVLENTQSGLELDTKALEKLETLGYVGGGIEEEFSFDQEKTDPKDLIEYHADMSRIQGLIQNEKFDEAEKVCEELIAQNITETYGQLCHFLVSIAKEKNDYQMAITYLQEIIKLNPDQPSAYIEYGGILLKTGETSQAAAQFLKANELRPDNAVISGNIAKAYYDGGKLNKAIEYCYKALELKPDYLLVRTSLADTLMKNNQLESAVKQYYEVLRLEPDNIEALNTLAWIQATSKDKDLSNPEEALRLALHCCQIDDYKRPELLDTLAAAYASNSQFDEAVKMATKAIQIASQQGLDERAGQMSVRLRQYEAAQRH